MEGGRIEAYPARDDFPGTDPNDQHLHSAAVAAGIDIVLTDDTRFIDVEHHEQLPYEIHLADSFLMLVEQASPELVRAVTRQQCEHALSRDGEGDLPARLRAAGAPEFANRVRQHIQHLTARGIVPGREPQS